MKNIDIFLKEIYKYMHVLQKIWLLQEFSGNIRVNINLILWTYDAANYK